MQLVEVNNKTEFNNFVAANESGSFLQSWEWGEWQSALGRKILRYWILDINNQKIGSVQFIKMPLPFGRFYLYSPYGPVLSEDGLRVTGDGSREFIDLLKINFKDAVFVRIEPKNITAVTHNPLLVTKSANIQPAKTLLVDLKKSEEQLLTEMHHKTRYNIKLAQKHGVEVKDEFDISIGHGIFFDEAIKLIAQTAKRQKFSTFPQSYYKNMADTLTLKKDGDLRLHIYKAVFQNQLLATAFMVDYGNTRTFLFGGSSEFHKNVMAPYLLHFQAIKNAKAKGLSAYDFWGIETSSGATPGFVRFKLGFGGQEKEYAGAWDVINKLWEYKIYQLIRKLNKFFR